MCCFGWKFVRKLEGKNLSLNVLPKWSFAQKSIPEVEFFQAVIYGQNLISVKYKLVNMALHSFLEVINTIKKSFLNIIRI
jgi:hypothetical protein